MRACISISKDKTQNPPMWNADAAVCPDRRRSSPIKKQPRTFPTYCASGPMCSSKTKNWFQIQPRLGRWCTSVSPLASLVWFLEGTLTGAWWLAP